MGNGEGGGTEKVAKGGKGTCQGSQMSKFLKKFLRPIEVFKYKISWLLAVQFNYYDFKTQWYTYWSILK